MESCLICEKHLHGLRSDNGWIVETEHLHVFHLPLSEEMNHTYLGALLIEPKRHVVGLDQLEEEEAREIGWMMARLSRLLKAEVEAEHVYSFVLGHHVPHLHVHLVPRYPGTPHEYWGTRVVEWEGAPRGGKEEVRELCNRIRHALFRSMMV
jgi:diadenosine tetraphosphate (Ap4A) HIT family hydrolase